VGSVEEISIGNLAGLVIQILKSPSTVEYIPYAKAYPPGFQDMLRRKPMVEKLVKYVGFQPSTPLRQIVEWTAASFQ
jgi:UDP-glucose 4-epimerase